MSTSIGNSGFDYVKIDGAKDKWGFVHTFTYNIIDSSTKETLFSLQGGTEFYGRGVNNSGSNNIGSTKTVLGKDEKYYYFTTMSGGLQWGIIQTSGIVLKKDRSVLTTVNFHPLYQSAPAVKVVPAEAPIVPINTGVVGENIPIPPPAVQRLPVLEDRESLLSKLIHWIERILGL